MASIGRKAYNVSVMHFVNPCRVADLFERITRRKWINQLKFIQKR